VLAAGIVSTAGALWLQVWAQQRTSAVRAAFIIALEPVFCDPLEPLSPPRRPRRAFDSWRAIMMLAVFVSMRKA